MASQKDREQSGPGSASSVVTRTDAEFTKERLAHRNLARLDLSELCVFLNNTGDPTKDLREYGYEMFLSHIESASDFTEKLWRLREKPWATPQLLADFLTCFDRAFKVVFGESQRGREYWEWPTVPVSAAEDESDTLWD